MSALAWDELKRRSQPVPADPSRGHQLFLAEWKALDGGVVEYRYQAFCRCYWSQRFPTGDQQVALAAYEAHC